MGALKSHLMCVQPSVVLCDGGALDVKAFLSSAVWDQLREVNDVDEVRVRVSASSSRRASPAGRRHSATRGMTQSCTSAPTRSWEAPARG